MKIFDTHAHYYDEKFKALDGGVEALLESREMQDTVCGIVCIGANYETSLSCIELAKKYDFMYCAVGIHPTDAQRLCGASPEEEVAKIYSLIDTPEKIKKNKIVAIGEIGFDYYWEPVDKELQYKYFDYQMQLAEKTGLPIIIHDREAHKDTFDMILKYPNVRGVIHSCSLSGEMAKDIARRGWYISFSGTVTFKNAQKVKDACAMVPLDKLLSETDAPYLAPHPHRGKMNNSILMKHTVEEMAQLHNLSFDEMAKILYDNAKTLFCI